MKHKIEVGDTVLIIPNCCEAGFRNDHNGQPWTGIVSDDPYPVPGQAASVKVYDEDASLPKSLSHWSLCESCILEVHKNDN